MYIFLWFQKKICGIEKFHIGTNYMQGISL